MGFSICWLAVKGKNREAVAEELGLTPTGEQAEFAESLFTGQTLPNEWFLLVINQYNHRFISPGMLGELSRNCEIMACSIEEHVMVSTSELWCDGALAWRVEHDAQQSIDNLNKLGALPDNYAKIEREFAEKQNEAGGKDADTDYFFDIPPQLAKSIVGFKHDEAGLEDELFEIFEDNSSSPATNQVSAKEKRPWWKLW